jgi:hypothetical protein
MMTAVVDKARWRGTPDPLTGVPFKFNKAFQVGLLVPTNAEEERFATQVDGTLVVAESSERGCCCRSRVCLERHLRLAVVSCCLIVGLSLLPGCGQAKKPWEVTYKVNGQVKLDGQDIPGARLAFVPKDPTVPSNVRPLAVVGSAGELVIGTYFTDDGIPAGEYQVSVVKFPVSKDGSVGPNVLPAVYSRPETSGLTVSIPATNYSEIPVIELTGKSKKTSRRSGGAAIR